MSLSRAATITVMSGISVAAVMPLLWRRLLLLSIPKILAAWGTCGSFPWCWIGPFVDKVVEKPWPTLLLMLAGVSILYATRLVTALVTAATAHGVMKGILTLMVVVEVRLVTSVCRVSVSCFVYIIHISSGFNLFYRYKWMQESKRLPKTLCQYRREF